MALKQPPVMDRKAAEDRKERDSMAVLKSANIEGKYLQFIEHHATQMMLKNQRLCTFSHLSEAKKDVFLTARNLVPYMYCNISYYTAYYTISISGNCLTSTL